MFDKFLSGHRNYHVKGINSFLIRESKPGHSRLLRVFQSTDECASKLVQYGDYSIAPHNHSFALKLYLLGGSAYNVEFKDNHGSDCNDYMYPLVINSKGFKFDTPEPTTLLVDQIRKITSNGVQMDSKTVHSIVAEPNSTWLTVETDTNIDNAERLFLYSKLSDFHLQDSSLYIPMNQVELQSHQYILDAANYGIKLWRIT